MPAGARSSTAGVDAQVRLREVDPDFLRFVPESERERAAQLRLPAVDLPDGLFDPASLFSTANASCVLVVQGMVNREIQIHDQLALRVLGPGAVIPTLEAPSPDTVAKSRWNAAGGVRLAILGSQFARAGARWPELQRNLLARFAEQNEEMAAQLALCQLPRVKDRLLAMLWLLAESWGKVTSAGTILPLHFTHDALGAMVGARRPTVTLALGELAEIGAVVRRADGWLLLESPPARQGEPSAVEPPRLLGLAPTAWARQDGADDEATAARLLQDRNELVDPRTFSFSSPDYDLRKMRRPRSTGVNKAECVMSISDLPSMRMPSLSNAKWRRRRTCDCVSAVKYISVLRHTRKSIREIGASWTKSLRPKMTHRRRSLRKT
jgi:CRP/FNR family transcriptional regulator, cyclic AMP receptor protein